VVSHIIASMFDPKMIAARWYFGEFMHEDMPKIAVEALEHEYDGPMLRRLAGLIKPTASDIPVREIDGAFREMGIRAPLSKPEAQLILAAETAKAVLSGAQDPFDAATHIRIYICSFEAQPPELAPIVKLSEQCKQGLASAGDLQAQRIKSCSRRFSGNQPNVILSTYDGFLAF
jgi:hypothetical protein